MTLAMGAIVGIVGLQRDIADLMYQDPVPNLMLPLWSFAAYGIARTAAPVSKSPVATAKN